MHHVVSSAWRTDRLPTVAGIDLETRARRSQRGRPTRLPLAMLVFFASVCAMPAALLAQETVVAGTVVSERSERPIPGAQVFVQGEVGKGAFNIPLIPASGTPYPVKGGNYGNTTCLPLPDVERFNNPNII